jgi:hypothetical protein
MPMNSMAASWPVEDCFSGAVSPGKKYRLADAAFRYQTPRALAYRGSYLARSAKAYPPAKVFMEKAYPPPSEVLPISPFTV